MRRAQKYKAEPQTERYAAGLNASKQSHRTHTTEADIDEVAAMRFLSLNLDNKARKWNSQSFVGKLPSYVH